MLDVDVREIPGMRLRRFVRNAYRCSFERKTAAAKMSNPPVHTPRK
jgi:hypothetical protein